MWSFREAIKDSVPGSRERLVRDVFGYVQGHLPRNPDGSATSMSLKAWAGLGRFNSFNVMTIFVGIESFTSPI